MLVAERSAPPSLEQALRVRVAEQLDQARDHPRPAGLVTRSETRAVVAVEVLVEEQVVAPVRVALELLGASENRPAPLLVAREDPAQPLAELPAHLEEI